MKTRITFISLSIILILSSCGSNGQDTFPDVINVPRSNKLKRVKGTKLFVNVPGTYKPFEKLMRLQKEDRTYFQVAEFPGGSFTEYKRKMSPEAIKRQGAKIEVYEVVKFNGFEGLYMEGPSKIEGETKIGLTFGDETFVTMVVGVCRTEDKSSRQELRNIFSNAYYEKSYKLNPLELADFQIDEKITGFKYAGTMANVIFYSPNGKMDTTGKLVPSYQLMPLNAGSLETIEGLMETINSRFGAKHAQISNIKKKEILIGDNRAYEITMDATGEDGQKGTIYEVGIFKEDNSTGLLFIAVDMNKGAYLDKFRATAQSIRL